MSTSFPEGVVGSMPRSIAANSPPASSMRLTKLERVLDRPTEPRQFGDDHAVRLTGLDPRHHRVEPRARRLRALWSRSSCHATMRTPRNAAHASISARCFSGLWNESPSRPFTFETLTYPSARFIASPFRVAAAPSSAVSTHGTKCSVLGHVARVADAAAGLHRPVRRLASEPVGTVVGHRHQVGDLHVVVAVELGGGPAVRAPAPARSRSTARRAGTGCPGCATAACPTRPARVPRPTASSMQNSGRAEARGGLPDAVLVDEALGERQPAVELAEDRLGADPHPVRQTSAWSVGMLNVHQ